jgi:hypothetical protein
MSAKLTPEKLFEGLVHEEDETLCAMLDGASVPDLLERLHAEPALEAECLFRGTLEPDMKQVAPYLVKLEPESEFAQWIVGTGWGHHWGTFVTSRQGFRKLRNHLRALTLVHRRDGTPLYFRYYDPRVMRVFLPTCTPDQLKKMFGPVDAFVAESEAGDAAHIYRLAGEGLSAVHRKLV